MSRKIGNRYLLSDGPDGKLFAQFGEEGVRLELENGDRFDLSSSELNLLWQYHQGEQLRVRSFGEFDVN